MELGSRHRLSASTVVLSTLLHPTSGLQVFLPADVSKRPLSCKSIPRLYREALKTEGTEGIGIPPQTDTNLFSSPLWGCSWTTLSVPNCTVLEPVFFYLVRKEIVQPCFLLFPNSIISVQQIYHLKNEVREMRLVWLAFIFLAQSGLEFC